MFDYARQRAREELCIPRTAVLVTGGPAGILAGEFPCEAIDLVLFLLLPKTSDHLFNLEHNPDVTLLTSRWEMKGSAQTIPLESRGFCLGLLRDPGAKWCVLVQVEPRILQVRREKGWGNLETIDLKMA